MHISQSNFSSSPCSVYSYFFLQISTEYFQNTHGIMCPWLTWKKEPEVFPPYHFPLLLLNNYVQGYFLVTPSLISLGAWLTVMWTVFNLNLAQYTSHMKFFQIATCIYKWIFLPKNTDSWISSCLRTFKQKSVSNSYNNLLNVNSLKIMQLGIIGIYVPLKT